MDIKAALATLETILAVTGPLITVLVGNDKKEAAEKVIDAAETALSTAKLALAGGEHAAAELKEIQAEMEAMMAAGGAQESDFDSMADRIAVKTARLKAIVAARKA